MASSNPWARLMLYDREQLRALTFADNLKWLQSFGCIVEERRGVTLVRHSMLPEYNAWLYTRTTPEALRQLEHILTQSEDPVALYVDRETASAAATELLRRRASLIGRSVTLATRVEMPDLRTHARIVVHAARPDEADEWARVYSQGFDRTQHAEVDRVRWRQAFASPHVRHWFFIEDDRRVGVCQTTAGPIPGLYSFTLLRGTRGIHRLRSAVRAVAAEVATQPSLPLYFEMADRRRWHSRLTGTLSIQIVRVMTAYQTRRVR